MSDLGFWGYTGIVAGLVLILAVCLFRIVFSNRTAETSTKESPTDTKHAA